MCLLLRSIHSGCPGAHVPFSGRGLLKEHEGQGEYQLGLVGVRVRVRVRVGVRVGVRRSLRV